MVRRAVSLVLGVLLSIACGEGKGGTEGTTGGSSTDASTSQTPTSGATSGSTSGLTSGLTSGSSSAGPGTSGTDTTGESTTTGMALPNFERFRHSSAAGPCPPDSDCDGFVELLATRVLRVEKFGDITGTVTEVEISEEDFTAAVAVFADEALVAVLDGPDPLCEPPTDVFESMEVVIDGVTHDATTTACDQPPLVAARAMVQALQTEYAP